jgi:hypothetical protein
MKTEKPPTAEPLVSTDWLAELDGLYKRFREVEKVAVWGGSYEREHSAQQQLKPIANKMFDALLKLLEERSSANDKLSHGE